MYNDINMSTPLYQNIHLSINRILKKISVQNELIWNRRNRTWRVVIECCCTFLMVTEICKRSSVSKARKTTRYCHSPTSLSMRNLVVDSKTAVDSIFITFILCANHHHKRQEAPEKRKIPHLFFSFFLKKNLGF